jgi:hypothetical protein
MKIVKTTNVGLVFFLLITTSSFNILNKKTTNYNFIEEKKSKSIKLLVLVISKDLKVVFHESNNKKLMVIKVIG